jgi:hypothetical protein
MKNLPEKDFWTALKDRLGNYTEMPDDDGWDKIAGALPRSSPSRWKGRVVGMILILTFGSVGGYFGYQYVSQEEGGRLSAGLEGSKSALVESATVLEDDHDDAVSDDRPRSTLSTAGNENEKDNEKSPALSSSLPSSSENPTLGNHTHKSDNRLKSSTSGRKLMLKQAQTETEVDLEGVDEQNKDDFADSDQSVANASHYGDTEALTNAGNTAVVTEEQQPEKDDAKGKIVVDVTTPLVVNTSSHETTHAKVVAAQSKTGSGSASETSGPEETQSDKAIEKQKEVLVSGASVASEKKEQKKKRIFHADVYFTLTPSLSFQKITPSGKDDVQVIGLVSDGTMSSDRLGFSFEAGFQHKLSRNIEVYAGLSYYRQRQRLGYEYNSDEVTVDYAGGGGHTITPIPAVKEFDYNMTNAGVSAGAFYHLTGDLLMHKIGAGFQFQQGLLSSGSEATYNNAKSYYFNYQLSYRLEVKVNPKVNVYLQPTFIHAIIAQEELSEPFTIKPYRAGLGFGMIYHF